MTDISDEDIELANFRFYHHNFRLKANSTDPFVSASYKRKSAAQYFHASLALFDNEGSSQIWEDRVLPVIALVDNRSEKCINNYAESTLALAANAEKRETKWKTNLRKSRPVLDVVQKLTDCPHKCHEWNFSEDILALAKQKSKNKKNIHPEEPKCSAVMPEPNQGSSIFRAQKPVSSSVMEVKGFSYAVSKGGNDDGPTNQLREDTRNNMFDISKKSVGFSESKKGLSNWGVLRKVEERVPYSENSTNCGSSSGVSRQGSFGDESNENTGRNKTFGLNHVPDSSKGFGVQKAFQNFNEAGENSDQRFSKSSQYYGNNLRSSSIRGATGSVQGGGNSGYVSRHGAFAQNNFSSNVQSDVEMSSSAAGFFRTAKEELIVQNQKKYGSRGGQGVGCGPSRGGVGTSGAQKRSLGTARRAGVYGKFVPPVRPSEEDDFEGMFGVKQPQMEGEEEEIDERLKNIDPKMVETIRNEIMDIGAPVFWDDIAGLEFPKKTIQEIVVWPLLRPDIFTGLRKPPKGLLLFGPPGTGKTLIGKCIASQSQSTFFSISASSLTSKWIGDGEKMVRALFAVARVHQPSVVFIDEIDSLLTQRSDTEHESSRRIKTEFLVQLDGAATGDEERILVVGATNRPQELDEAARRRLVKRLYIPLPEYEARRQIVQRLMSTERCALTCEQVDEIATLTDGYSGADMKTLCQEASLGPIRSISLSAMHQITPDQVRSISIDDFTAALQRVRASVSNKDLDTYVQWDKTYGMGSGV